MNLSEIIGHDDIKAQLQTMHKQKNVPQVMIFHGRKSIGKQNLALAFAKELLNTKKEQHVDLIRYHPDKERYDIKKIKDILKELSFPPYESECKVMLLDDVDSDGFDGFGGVRGVDVIGVFGGVPGVGCVANLMMSMASRAALMFRE